MNRVLASVPVLRLLVAAGTPVKMTSDERDGKNWVSDVEEIETP
jgi:hypothetical protein